MDLKGFYQAAKKELEPLYGGYLNDFRLEQVEHDKKNQQWEVVVSYLVENKNKVENSAKGISVITSLPYERIYQLLVMNSKKEVKELRMLEKAS